MKHEKLKDRVKKLDVEAPQSYPDIIIVNIADGETLEEKIKASKIPDKGLKDLTVIYDDIV